MIWLKMLPMVGPSSMLIVCFLGCLFRGADAQFYRYDLAIIDEQDLH